MLHDKEKTNHEVAISFHFNKRKKTPLSSFSSLSVITHHFPCLRTATRNPISKRIPKLSSMITVTAAIYAIFLTLSTSFPIVFSTHTPKSYYHSLFLSTSLADNASVAHNLYMLTRRPHVAGTEANAETADYVLTTLTSHNINSHIVSYDVALTYPDSRSLTLTPKPGHPPVAFDLRQEIYAGDPYADVASQVMPTFHGFAKSGDVTAPVTYANYGGVEDFTTLKEMGVNVSGTIVLARYGKVFRGDIVHNAYTAGAVGTIIYSDRKDYGGGGKDAGWFPEAKWLPPTGAQMGNVYTEAGDPTTPGWPSNEGCERRDYEEVERLGIVPSIPSLPVSGADGETIMKSIGGKVADEDWQGSDDAPTYRVGPGPGVLNLNYKAKKTIATIHNVIGMIEGSEEPDRYVILGNHRDAWTFGAVDPNSGTATLLEVVQRLEKLQKKGWKPRRTIIFCSWDAEEYGLIGSTEWVEDNRELLASRAVAYLNVDIAVSGDEYSASATPQLDELLKQAAKQVQDPDNSSQTVYDSWASASSSSPSVKIERLGGGGSDFAAFVQHIGVASLEVTYGGAYPVYHSMYDDFVWMEKFGDPMFRRHIAVASIWGYLALQLADKEILPFNYQSYAEELQRNAEELEDQISNQITVTPLLTSIDALSKAAAKINNEIKGIEETIGWASIVKADVTRVREINDRLMMAERAFLDREGLSGRPWYKHMIYAPAKHNVYGTKYFPGIDDAIEQAKRLNTEESWKVVQHEVWRVSRAINQVTKVLSGELT
ncbi:unnamed protein product [Linum tenue]|uniref:Glutamate carboxypeptidase 2 n=1 Tax=Linum tenue TaxID=586396 RepID=A0AAV0S5X9_9ROSI|nr:unnamed protein product [Linum tenue]